MTNAGAADMLDIEFAGYGLMRIPTDPDPTDETRGVSGYTFVFGNEPDFDRVIRLQPEEKYIRTHSPPMGVFVRDATRRSVRPGVPDRKLPLLVGAAIDWEDMPKLENRNLILTVAGMEPIVPFNMRIRSDRIDIYRTVPVNPRDPTEPVYKASPSDLARMAAFGMYPEPDTVRRATGLWDPYKRLLERIELLEKDKQVLKAGPQTPKTEDMLAVIEGRLAQLYIGRDNPSNRRVANSVMVERFGFGMDGGVCSVTGQQEEVLGGKLDTATTGAKGPDGSPAPTGWEIAFWVGCWDADLLCAYFEGTLKAPYAA